MAREKPLEVPPYAATAVDVLRLPDGAGERDQVAVEEPLEIRIGGRAVAVTMRTPGHDEELTLGFCLSEGLQPESAAPPADLAANTIEAEAPGFDPARLQRSFYTSSSCGVCGKGALEAVAVEAPHIESRLQVPLVLLADLPERLRAAQPAFAATGGLHATGLFTADGELLCLREDVGRHKAMDKVVGWAFREDGFPWPTRSSASAAASPSSSSKRRRSPAAGSWSRSERRRASPSTSGATEGSRSAASPAADG